MKSKIILSVAVLFAIVCLLVVKSINDVKELGKQLLTIDRITDWYSNRNSPIEGIVNIGDGLYGVLTLHHVPLKDIEVKSQLGDCFGDSWLVTHSIVIVSPKSCLCIRLRYDILLRKYHIVGYSGRIE